MTWSGTRSLVAVVAAAALVLAGCSAGSGLTGSSESGASASSTSEVTASSNAGVPEGSTTAGADQSSSGSAATPAPSDGTLSLGLVLAPANMDFTTTDGAAIPQVLLSNVYETLVTQAQDGSIQPGLAKSWTVSADAKTYDFTIRSGVTFSDGTPFTAADAAFSIDYVKTKWTVGVAKAMEVVTSATAVSPTELKVVLAEPNALWLFKMTTRIGAMMSPKHVDKLATEAIGTGPFVVSGWQPNQSVTLTRNDKYWGSPAHEKNVVFTYFSDSTAMNNALLTGAIQVITTVQTPQALAQFKSGNKYTIINGTTNGKVMMTMNDGHGPLSDIRVRQAINYALDKPAILKGAWAGYGTVIGSHEVPTDPWYVDLANQYPHNIAKAKQLLAEAGKSSLTLRLALPPVPYAAAAAPIIVSQLAQVGITVKTSDVTFDNWLAKIFGGDHDYDLTIINHVEQYDVTTVFSGKPDYYTQYTNPEVTKLETAGLAGDHDTFIADFKKVVTILADDAAAAWLWAFPNLMVTDSNVHGLPENAIGESLDVSGLYTD
ncbi:MAG: ABC transporter substrate-binding protein [Nakamurella sp.]